MLSQNENKDIMLADKIKRVDELMNSIKSSIDGDTEASLAVKDALDRWNKMFL